MNDQGDLIFTLDIGTRTVIGLVAEYRNSAFKMLASRVVEHEQRSMLDGQIHNVNEVVKQVNRVKEGLAEDLDLKLERVAIAAAGRALKTVNYEKAVELEYKRVITADDVQTLEFTAVQEAQRQLMDSPADYHFVGYSVTEYQLDDMFIGNPEGQTGRKIMVKIVATFLPRIVINSLITVINRTGLEVDYLTLEPIAAAEVVIPRDMYSFNLALIDIGAGTSDIALTRGGAMIGYAMVPIAGDEVTEALAEYYLLDYQTGERLKRSLGGDKKTYHLRNILSQEVEVSREEALGVIGPVIEEMAQNISQAIMAINGKAPQAVICVGGGSLTPGIRELLAEYLGINQARVGIKDSGDISMVDGRIDGVNSVQAITPLGITITSYYNKHRVNFVEVEINQRKIQIFSLGRPAVADALLAGEIDLKQLRGSTGMGLTCYVNGELKVLKGTLGRPGEVYLNGEKAGLEDEVGPGDKIKFVSGQDGQDASGVLADVLPGFETIQVKVGEQEEKIGPSIYQNGRRVEPQAPLVDGAKITIGKHKSISDILNLVKELPLEINDGILYYQGFSITFNDNELKIPVRAGVYAAGEELNLAQEVPGNLLTILPETVMVEDILTYINYRVQTVADHLLIKINGQRAKLKSVIQDGDELQIEFKGY